MGRITIPLKNRIFSVEVELRMVASNKASVKTRAIIDTGASNTCISYSHVSKLGVQPIGEYAANRVAGSGVLFSRSYPVNIGIGGTIYRILPCCVLFQAEQFMSALVPHNKPVPSQVINQECEKLNISKPPAWMDQCRPRSDGQFDRTFFRPGIGLEQEPLLIGMDFMGNCDWHYDSKNKELVID